METQNLIDEIGKMTVLELNDLVKALEDKFGVSAQAAMPMMMPGMMPGAEEAEEQTEFDVVLKEFGSQKIKVIKVARELTSLGLKEAKALVDSAPTNIKEKISKEDAEKAKAALEEAGAVVEIK